jgi:hypothetical protein
VQIPVLKWSSRRNNAFTEFVSKVVLAGEVLHEGVIRPILLVFDTKKRDIEQVKVL